MLAVALFAVGCASPVNTNECASIVDVGTMSAPIGELVDGGAIWETSSPYDPNGTRVAFDAYTTYRVWHGLGHVPAVGLTVYVGFNETGILAQQIGNVAEIVPSCNGSPGATANYVLIRNAGGQNFYAIFEIQ